jgi:hypothetical protein
MISSKHYSWEVPSMVSPSHLKCQLQGWRFWVPSLKPKYIYYSNEPSENSTITSIVQCSTGQGDQNLPHLWSRNELPQGASNRSNKLWSGEIDTSDDMVKIRAKEESNTPLPEADVSKLTKNTYHLPTKLVPMLRSLKIQMCILKIFFGPDAFVSICYQEFMDKLATCEQDMETMITEDSTLLTYSSVSTTLSGGSWML